MAECRAAVITAVNEPLEIRLVPIPDLEPTGMLARVDAATLCGTDVHRWHGSIPLRDGMPFIPGHETCGAIVDMNGPRTDLLGEPLKPGDRVLWAYPSCGRCYWCTVAKQPTLCPEIMTWGCNRSDRYPYLLGGCAEYQYVPPRCDVIRVPDTVSAPSAAAAACAYRTVMHGFERLGAIGGHETVLVQGSGPLGLFSAAVARERGAHSVLMIGAPAARLAVAKDLGVDAMLNLEDVPAADDRRQWVLDHTGGRGADTVIQCATFEAVPEGVKMVRPGGRYLSIGVGGPAVLPIADLANVNRMITFITVAMAEPRHWLQAIDFLASRKTLPFDNMISASYSLDRATEAFQDMASMQIVKPVIVPHA